MRRRRYRRPGGYSRNADGTYTRWEYRQNRNGTYRRAPVFRGPDPGILRFGPLAILLILAAALITVLARHPQALAWTGVTLGVLAVLVVIGYLSRT